MSDIPNQPMVPSTPHEPSRPLIFISHDHRDEKLAEAFATLLTDVSGGSLELFRSSDRTGSAGIEFGRDWYAEIIRQIYNAKEVVALLTPHSVDRPWILYEAGVAMGRLGKPALGVAVGIPLDQAVRGPFAQFQNSSDEEDSLTTLMLQLVKCNPLQKPQEETVRGLVRAFREHIKDVASLENEEHTRADNVEARVDAAKLFEEIKVMFRDLPGHVRGQLWGSFGPQRRCRLLFPFVTNQSNFDTGITIANLSRIMGGQEPRFGSVKLIFYGNVNGEVGVKEPP